MTDVAPAADLTVEIGSGHKGDPLRLVNPIIAAAGTLGTGVELQRDIDLTAIGALVTPAISRRVHRRPAVLPRESPAGLFLSGPYPSIRLRDVLDRYALLWEGWSVPVIANIAADDADESVEVATALARYAGVAALELSFVSSAPWLDGDGSVTEVRRLCRRLSDTWPRPLIVKLPYGLSNTLALIEVAIGGGADAISIGGGFPAAVVDQSGSTGGLRLVRGRVTGPATKSLALHAIAAVCAETAAPVIASGGITSGTDALDFLLAGARAVQVGSASLRDPSAPVRVAWDLERLARGTGQAAITAIGGGFGDEEPPR
jgi:dihydroorotate dehydrogenase (NAD+) catalytic subunit